MSHAIEVCRLPAGSLAIRVACATCIAQICSTVAGDMVAALLSLDVMPAYNTKLKTAKVVAANSMHFCV